LRVATPDALDALDAFSDEFVQVLEAQRSEQQSAQDREAL
jgi:hypothetical protein